MTKKLTKEKFVQKANIIHGSKYQYIGDYIKSNTNIEIICPSHGSFLQTPNTHLNGRGCRKCGTERTNSSKKSNTIKFVQKAKEKHNNKYEYFGEYVNSRTKIEIFCPSHGSFWQLPTSHLYGAGCSECGLIHLRNCFSHGKNKFIQKAKEIHGNKYDYIGDYVNRKMKIEISCPIHGIFNQTPANHIQHKQGCPQCGFISTASKKTLDKDEFISKAKEIHGNKYDYVGLYVKSINKIEIKCNKHGSFFQSPNNHLGGKGCPHCGLVISNPETEWLNSLNIPTLIRQYPIKVKGRRRSLVVDGYNPDTNTVYQFHGDFWHGNPNVYICPIMWNKRVKKFMWELYKKTIEKEKSILDLGYKLVVKWETDKNETINILV